MSVGTDTVKEPLARCLALTRAYGLLAGAMDRALANAHGLSYSEFLILLHILKAPQMRMRRLELAERVGLTASGVTRALAPLEKRGLVTRDSDPRDARIAFACLTTAGARDCADALETAHFVAERLAPQIGSIPSP